MRDALVASGLRFEELLGEMHAVELGCLSAVEYLQREGSLLHKEYLCEAAARSGNLEKLKVFRANDIPWGRTCLAAARGGHLEVLQWTRERLSLGRDDVHVRGAERASRDAAVGAREWLPVER